MAVVALVAGCTGSEATETEYTGEARRFVVDGIDLPLNNGAARELGLDLNDDGTVDNQLGIVVGALSSIGNITSHGRDMMAAGVIASSVEILADDHQDDRTVAIRYFGSDGEASQLIGGELVAGAFVTTIPRGEAMLHLPVFIGADPSILRLLHARMAIEPDGAGGYIGVIAGAVDPDEARQVAFEGAMQMIAANPADHRIFFELLDTKPMDHVVTRDEWNTNALVGSLMAADVELGGRDLLSLGFRIHLTPCAAGRCSTAPPEDTCYDRVMDGDETDVDCGGSCTRCGAERACTKPSDCQSNACNGTCAAPTCSDGVRDGFETSVDCGASCGGCGLGETCFRDLDCLTGQCGPPCTGTPCFDTYDTCR